MRHRLFRQGKRFSQIAATAVLSAVVASSAFGAPGRSLFADVKASQVGDLITILVIESTQASRSASTQTLKKNGLGLVGSVKSGGSDANGFSGDLTTSAEHNGGGTTSSSGVLRTTVTATVTEVLPGGNLKVQGSRELVINNEKETLTVSGTVRQKDIMNNNTVLSNQLANASISYTGDGWIAKQNKPNIFLRVLSAILPIF